MQLSGAQLAQILQSAGIAGSLRDLQVLGARSYAARLDERAVVLRFAAGSDRWAGDALAVEAAALRQLAVLADARIPELIGHVAARPDTPELLIVSRCDGRVYADRCAALDETQQHALGSELAELLARVHGLSTANCGPLLGALQAAPMDYLLLRADAAAVRAAWPLQERERLMRTLRSSPLHSGRATLVHGDLQPRRILVTERRGRVQLSGLVGWSYAQYWHPAWDHRAVQDGWADPSGFAFRIGYGSTYDAVIPRPAEQVREYALLPYRLVAQLDAGREYAARVLLTELEQMTLGSLLEQTESEIV